MLVEVRGLKKYFPIKSGILRRTAGYIKAVDGISFDIYQGETLGLVGERGCGKSTLARSILLLEKPTAGTVKFAGRELTRMGKNELRQARRHMQMIFQDPYASLNPRMTVGNIISEPLIIHGIGDATERKERVQELLRLVGLNPYFVNRSPHEFSGGQRQRIGVARALATNPSFIVADEPISTLDKSIQGQVINLLGNLKADLGLTYLFITRDLSTAGAISDRIAIMYLGAVVELSARDEIYNHPLHPYTQALLSTIPLSDPEKEANRRHIVLEGDVPSPANLPSGCRFHPRCAYATDVCREVDPEFRDLGTRALPHMVACHHAEQFV